MRRERVISGEFGRACRGGYSHGYLHGAVGAKNAWGNLRWSARDFFAHHMLDIAYPGYVNGAIFRNETGIFSPTPFGDSVDVLLADAHEKVLQTYATLILGGILSEEPKESGGWVGHLRR